jgi:hypothetical protein
MFRPSNEGIPEIKVKLRKENPQFFGNAHQELKDAAAQERQQRLKARLFQREVASATAAATLRNQIDVQRLRPQAPVS